MDCTILSDVSLQATAMLHTYASMLERLRYDIHVHLEVLLQKAKRLKNDTVVMHCLRDRQTLEVASVTLAGRMVDAVALSGLHALNQHSCVELDKAVVEFHLSDLYFRSARALQWSNSEALLSPEGVLRVNDSWKQNAEPSTKWEVHLVFDWQKEVDCIIRTCRWETVDSQEDWIPNFSLISGLHMTESQIVLQQESHLHNHHQTLSSVVEVLRFAHRVVSDACGLKHVPTSHASGMQHALLHILANTTHRIMEANHDD